MSRAPIALGAAFACACTAATPPVTELSHYPVGSAPRAVAAGDIDGDGDRDLAVANSGSDDASLLVNDGSGRFAAAAAPLAAGPEPSDVALADVNADGHLDAIFANHETDLVTVLAGDGHGGFLPLAGSPFSTGSVPHVHGLAVADFDGDGYVDVAVDSADDDRVRVLFGDADGLGAVQAFMTGRLPYYRVGARDVTKDGVAELLVPNQRDLTVSILGRAGPGVLAPVADATATPRTPWMVRGGDLDGDGREDLAVLLTDGVALLRGTGGGHFEAFADSPVEVAEANEIAVGDLDGDGAADVAVGPWVGDVVLLSGATRAQRRVAAGNRPIGLAIADVDGDGRNELIVAATLDDEVLVVRQP